MNNYVIIGSLKSEPTCKLINRIPGLCLFISSLPDPALRTHVESFGKPRDVNNILEALPGTLDIKRHSPSILYFHNISSRKSQIKLFVTLFL